MKNKIKDKDEEIDQLKQQINILKERNDEATLSFSIFTFLK